MNARMGAWLSLPVLRTGAGALQAFFVWPPKTKITLLCASAFPHTHNGLPLFTHDESLLSSRKISLPHLLSLATSAEVANCRASPPPPPPPPIAVSACSYYARFQPTASGQWGNSLGPIWPVYTSLPRWLFLCLVFSPVLSAGRLLFYFYLAGSVYVHKAVTLYCLSSDLHWKNPPPPTHTRARTSNISYTLSVVCPKSRFFVLFVSCSVFKQGVYTHHCLCKNTSRALWKSPFPLPPFVYKLKILLFLCILLNGPLWVTLAMILCQNVQKQTGRFWDIDSICVLTA